MAEDTNTASKLTDEDIARCAYLIWEKEGKQEGREREYWVQAETQLRACQAHEGWINGNGASHR